MLELLAADHRSLSSVTDPAEAWRAHVADSMTGLEVPELARAKSIADLGAGAGFPGLVLALALPGTTVDLIESVGRKCEFMRGAISAAGIPNARAVNARSEE
ncbi:MAG: RsmG family class I SAM-dependent methyltransferase, partial [Solirubrobacterales bacterium]